ncbi:MULTISPECIES: SLC13 family permease [unclassified Thiobacillus]|uniref:SLC13 family permease n=1 Tax=unclassified Thiobacillus TaxID=2646513 RepID=UPI000869EF86|nr:MULTISPECIES: SLC13 family permease [unclassified Thiobacillus]MBN8779217.1 citrate transporter [Thiobacillus sp.]ODU99891.1 MAG: citrate transporter [Thiobacillus sp. SCN 63-57]
MLPFPVEFFFFALTLLGVALMHQRNFEIALTGLVVIALYKVSELGYPLLPHLGHEAPLLLNLLGLLLGFAILAKVFEESHVPDLLPHWLPDDWRGGFLLLVLVAVISSFLDNIAAAMIGGVIARRVFQGKVMVGYLAAIVAASNAGGAGSVVGDTTTTMMWIAGVPALHVADAFIASIVAVTFSAFVAAHKQHAYQPIRKDWPRDHQVDWVRLGVVGLIIGGAIAANVILGLPAVGVWAAIVLGALIRPAPWREAFHALKGSLFLIFLVTAASLMPVDKLPAASVHTTFGLGFVSAVFDNIPLTKLALDQGGYDWGMLAFAVGFGGSMIWFGSSAGVAITNEFEEAKNTGRWIREGWHVAMAYVLGFWVLYFVLGWVPEVILHVGG